MKVKALTPILCGSPENPKRFEEGDEFEYQGKGLSRLLDNGTLEALEEFTSEDLEAEPESTEETETEEPETEIGPDFESMTTKELKEELKALGLPVKGRQAELIERLRGGG